MTLAPSLLEQRVALREQLHEQRREVAGQLLEAKAGGRFPRSITMKVLIHQPELAGRLLSLVAGARVAGSVSALLLVAQVMRAARTCADSHLPAQSSRHPGLNPHYKSRDGETP